MLLISCLLLIGAIHGSLSDECDVCGISPVQSRVHGGETIQKNEFPWLVRVRLEEKVEGKWLTTSRRVCGGVIIGPRNVLTSRKCIEYSTSKWQILIDIGAHNVDGWKESIVGLYDEITDSDYIEKVGHTDIAVLKLSEPLKFSKTIAPICVAEKLKREKIEDLVVAGWGRFEAEKDKKIWDTKPTKLNVTITEKNCHAETDHQFCAKGDKRGSGVCFRDYGDPMMYFKNDRWFLYGLVGNDKNCGEWDKPILGYSVSKKIKSIFSKAPTMCLIAPEEASSLKFVAQI
ncbi:transmembrane protease serine 11B-like protein isoform X2 [Brevipalpus obovatus]|uniref:transmembrane protease serine 11B-like protein isoform X2 n=1 Tax=Brevipalpus obovatus TaxID=246614 RepID=UPI003D9F9B12